MRNFWLLSYIFNKMDKPKVNGNVKRKQRNNKNIKVLPQIKVFILEIIKENPFLTLLEIAHLVSTNFDIVLSQMTINNVLKQNKITRKRRKLRYFPPDQKISKAQELKQFYKNLDKIDKKKLISLDETAIYINMMPIYGRAKSGKRLIVETSNYPFKKYNLLCAIKENRIVGWVLYENLNEIKIVNA